jgi:hypothetical protein
MVKRSAIVVTCAALVVAFAPNLASAQTVFNPQGGINLSRLSSDPGGPDDFSSGSRVGYQFGFTLRLGDFVYLQPGAFWMRTGAKLTSHPLEGQIASGPYDLEGFYFPLSIGTDLIGRRDRGYDEYRSHARRGYGDSEGEEGGEEPPPVILRLNAGGSAMLLNKVRRNDFELEKGDFENTLWSVRFGVGMDISALTLDAAYDIGVSKEFRRFTDAKNNMLTFTAGIKFE